MTALPVLTHRVDGDGPPLLLLNGGMMSFGAWEPVARRLVERHRVIRCDFRGQLLSPGSPPRDFREHADDLVEVLDATGTESAHVVGTSFGAEAGIVLAARFPGRVASLALVTATDLFTPLMKEGGDILRAACRDALCGGDRALVYDVMSVSAFSPAWREANASLLATRRYTVGFLPDAWFSGLDGLLSSLEGLDLRPELANIACSTLVVSAELDLVMPRERSEALARSIFGAKTAVVTGSGHALVVEKPEELLSLLEPFLAATDPAA
ncbi:MAG: alpha/beta fold hydrolase [Thermoanaerobaculia bacterium]